MGQSVHPITVRYGASQLWNFSWLGTSHQLHYPYTIKLFRFFSKFIQIFFLYQLYIRTSIFFFSDMFNWRTCFIKQYLKKKSLQLKNNKLNILYFFTKALAINQFKYKRLTNSKVRIRKIPKNQIKSNLVGISDITRNTRLVRAVSSIRQYLIPPYFYQIRYSYLLNSFPRKLRKQRFFKFKKANKRFLFTKNSTLIAGSVHLFRYKAWVLFLWYYLVSNLKVKINSKYALRRKKNMYFNSQALTLRTKKKLKRYFRGNELLTFGGSNFFLF